MQIDGATFAQNSGAANGSLQFSADKLNLCLIDDEVSKLRLLESIDSQLTENEPFKPFFVIEQDESLQDTFVDPQLRLSILGHLESRSDTSTTIDNAIKTVTEKLEKYPFRNKQHRIEDLLTALNRGKALLEERLHQLERERLEASILVEELRRLEDELETIRRTQKREEYFQLCLETAELDSRIMKVQQRLLHEAELKRELQSLGNLSRFPISALRKVNELWTKRLARISDKDRLFDEISAGEQEIIQLQSSFLAGAGAIQEFSLEDTQQLYGLAKIIEAANTEVEQLQHDRSKEMRRVKEAGVDFDAIALLRKTILAMKPSDLEEAYRLQSELKSNKDTLNTAIALTKNMNSQLKTLELDLISFNAKGTRAFQAFTGLLSFSAALLVVASVSKASEYSTILMSICLTCFFLLLAVLIALPQLFKGVRNDLDTRISTLAVERDQHADNELKFSEAVAKVQQRAEQLAVSNQFRNAADMFKKLQTYAGLAAQLKQLDLFDHLLAAREQQLENLLKEANDKYFKRLDRKLSKITTAACTALAGEILLHKEQHRELDRNTTVIEHRRSELRFLEGEINDINSMLRDFFYKAGLTDPEDLDKSYEEFEQKSQNYRKWDSITIELERMSKDLATEILENDLGTVLMKLQHRRTDAWAKMQDLIGLYPGILSETIDDTEIGRLVHGESTGLENSLQTTEQKAEELRQRIRSMVHNFDEFHPRTKHELEVLERDLKKVNHNKQALELARASLIKVAQESKSFWAHELKELSDQFLKGLDLEIEEIIWDKDLHVKIKLKGEDSALEEEQLKLLSSKGGQRNERISRGLTRLVSWLPRMILCQYVSRKSPFPLVLEEPFFDLDDKRFADCMKLLLKNVLKDCQIIVLSSQKVRFSWFLENLSAPDKALVDLKQL
ncbi:MAG: hypothetical protein K2X77_01555 [Candidatus Obscuribacterales bacterium]|jgi:hypothetical protein|nr:hypothetical protein [Candidatus Obscuribacterales bacterium]